MLRRHAATVTLLAALAAAAPQAQSSGQKPQPQKPAEPAPRAEPGNPVNVRIEVTITESGGRGTPQKQVVSLMTSDRMNGIVRSTADVKRGDGVQPVAINVDARPTMLREGTLRLELALEYQPQESAAPAGDGGRWRVTGRANVVLQPDKPVIVTETFDPSSERRVTVEVKATVSR